MREDPLRVTAILDEDVQVEHVNAEDTIALKSAIRQRILEGTVESMTLVNCAGLLLPRGPRRLRQRPLEFACLNIDDADGIMIAIDQRLAIGRKG
jgi:hypothetical protein